MAARCTTYIVFCVLAWTLLLDEASCLVLDTPTCFVPPPCTCSRDTIDCSQKGLTTLPRFGAIDLKGENFTINLFDNQLTTVPSNAFIDIQVSDDTSIVLVLRKNNIDSISSTAFSGIKDAITELYIQDNHLTEVPLEVVRLSKLHTLYLKSNLITSYNPAVMHALDGRLQRLGITIPPFSSWPSELNILTSLSALDVTYYDVNHLGSNMFDGFANTLHSLTISSSFTDEIPAAICKLHNLRTLEFTDNRVTNTDSRLLPPCNRPLASVTMVTLDGNHLTKMPNVFTSFPSMISLHVSSNNLSYINSDTIRNNHPLTRFLAGNNAFRHIPMALNKLKALVYLDLSYNKITSIGDSSLSGLTQLMTVFLGSNPIQSISPYAFHNALSLTFLSLTSTNLHTMPSFIAASQSLKYIELKGSPIECNCGMLDVKQFNLTRININGLCKDRPIQIETYITDLYPDCLSPIAVG